MSQEVKPIEKSVSYIAWSVKEMAESLKKMASLMAEFVANQPKSTQMPQDYIRPHKQDELPF